MPVWRYETKAIAPRGFGVALYEEICEDGRVLKATVKMNMHWALKYREFKRGVKVCELSILPFGRGLKHRGSSIDLSMFEAISERLRECFVIHAARNFPNAEPSDAPRRLAEHVEMVQKSNVEFA